VGHKLGRDLEPLEEYQSTHSHYPESLDALSPDFLILSPKDIIGGAPLKYRLVDNTNLLLYSIGSNQKDDGGISGSYHPTRFDLKRAIGSGLFAGS
jgi:hypothetical protein